LDRVTVPFILNLGILYQNPTTVLVVPVELEAERATESGYVEILIFI
jgi:hypothetical protein